MGALVQYLGKIWDRYEDVENKEKDRFNKMKNGLKNSIEDINLTLKPIHDWDELLNLNSDEEIHIEPEVINDLNKSKISNISNIPPMTQNYISKDIGFCYSFCSKMCGACSSSKCCLLFCFICGFLFVIVQLIGVQLGLIILNALFNEIVDEFKLLSDIENPKEYTFYEKLEIASYKSIPEIDVGMFWSFIGIIVLKKYGFLWSNIFQVLSLAGFVLLLILFDFHTGDKLLTNYSRMEFTALIFGFIILSITVGASSTVALKQFSNLYFTFYLNHFDLTSRLRCCNLIDCCGDNLRTINSIKNENVYQNQTSMEKKDDVNIKEVTSIEQENDLNKLNKEEMKKEDERTLQQLFFFNFSIISSFLIIIIIRQIFKSYDITSKWILKHILVIYSATFVGSLIFYVFFSIPLINKQIKKKIKMKRKQLINTNIEKMQNNHIMAESTTKFIDFKNETLGLKNNTLQNNQSQIYKNEIEEIGEIKKDNMDNTLYYNNNIINEAHEDKAYVRICTCIGYVFFQKKIGNVDACILVCTGILGEDISLHIIVAGEGIETLHESFEIFVLSRCNLFNFLLLYILHYRLIKIHFQEVKKPRKSDNRKSTEGKN